MTFAVPSSGSTLDLVFLMCFLAAMLIPFCTYLVLWRLGIERLPAAKDKGSGSRLLGPLLIGFYYWLLSPFLRLAKQTGLRPNHFTFASLVTSIPTGVAIATGHFALGAVLLIFGNTMDVVDGYLARSKGLVSKAGAFFDSTVDRVCDGMILGGFAVYYAGTSTMFAALVALLMSFATSYTRARGEALGVSGSEGLMQRGDRLVILSFALAFSPYVGHLAEGFVPHPSYAVAKVALWLLAILSTFTAVTRIVWIMKKLASETSGPMRTTLPLAMRTVGLLLNPKAAPSRAFKDQETRKTQKGPTHASLGA